MNPNNIVPDSTYSSARGGPMKNENQLLYNNNAPNVPYSSAREGQNKRTIIVDLNSGEFRDINKSNDSWNQMNPLVESKASIQSGILNQNNVHVQDISSKVVQLPK